MRGNEDHDLGVIRTVEEAQTRVPSAVRELQDRPELALAAAVDPLRALEMLGHRIDPELVPVLRRRIRFSLETWERLEALVADIRDAAGRQVDVDDPDVLEELLFEELHLPRPEPPAGDRDAPSATERRLTDPLPVAWGTDAPDPLHALHDAHPVMPPLLAYRRLEASRPRLGDEQDFRRALEGEGLNGVTSVRFRLQAQDG